MTKFTKEEKEKFVELIKDIDLEELLIPDEANRQWFKFGAYEALRIIAERILGEEKKNESTTRQRQN